MNDELVINDDWKILDFGITVDAKESYFPIMPETIDSNTQVSGADGEIDLGNTTYGTRNFELVCYSNENLDQNEKLKFINKITAFLHSHKNKTFRLVIKPYRKSYDVKYSGAISNEIYYRSVKLTIPLKSSSSFGYVNTKSIVAGDGEKESITVEDVGFTCSIEGPASNPVSIYVNGEQMKYENVILEGEKVVINTKISTVTSFSSTGEKNVLKYYNKVFPRVKNGNNKFEIKSLIADRSKVVFEWDDLTF